MSSDTLRYVEDFKEGDVLTFGDYEVTREEIVAFAEAFDPQPFHLDDAMASETLLHGLAASGWHTCAIGMRLVFDGFLKETASLGSPGIDEVRWLKPIRPGDRLTLSGRVTAARASKSRPERGIVSFAFQLDTQHGVCVMTQKNSIMVRCRTPGGAG